MTAAGLFEKFGITRAVFAALMGKFWGSVSGLVTLALLSAFLTAETQGYYYTFLSLIALQTFFDLSFSSVIVNFAAHEWSHLNMTSNRTMEGEPHARARLAAIFRFTFQWYAALGCLFALAVGIGGYYFLERRGVPGVGWRGPWLTLVPLAAVQLFLLPLQSILEGCNQIGRVSFIRLLASVAASVGLWAGLTLQMGLWAVCLSFGLNCLVQTVLGLYYYFPFYRALTREQFGGVFDWKQEALPLQWRLAVAGIFGYFATSYFVPIIFWYHGPAAAGQMGMGWQIMVAAQSVALTWVYANTPAFGALIAKRDYAALDRLFRRVVLLSLGAITALAAAAWGLVKFFNVIGHRFAERCMTPNELLFFLGAAIFMQLPQCEATYLRAHKKEPLLASSIFTSVVTGFLAWWFGKHYGIGGLGAAYLFTVACVVLPCVTYIWYARRKEWHA